jgi:endo-1,3(4)-beta-glucanase
VPVVTLEDDEPMPGGVATQPLFANVAHPDTPNALWGTTARPYPTGAFWTNLVVGAGDGPVGVYPYGIKTLDVGIQVSYGASRRIVSKKAITDNFVADLQIAAVSPNAAHSVEKHDKLSVTMGYKTTANGKYRVHIVKSSPFVTVVYENAAPMITSSLMHILTVEPQVVKDSTGVQYIVTLGNYQKWLVYCSEPMPLSFTGNALFSLTPIRGFIRVAILPVQNYQVAFTTLMQYVRRYPTGAVVAVQYPSDQVAVVDVEYTTVGDGELLMLSLPHHEAVMVEPDLASEDNVRLQAALTPIWCIKGKLKAVLGAKWRLQYNLTQVGWNYVLSDKLSTSRMDEIGANLMREVSQVAPTAEDPYSFGKQLQRLAALALLADNLGIADARKTAMDTIKAALTPWLLGTNSNAFVYDSTYGGLLNTNSLTDKFSDFGAGWYSDHHFHYGYIIYAAAVVAKLDSGAQGYFSDVANKNAMALLVKDICGMDDQDSDFPFARHKDLFDGHSWASGLFQQGNGKGQESSSEVGAVLF